MVKLYTDEVKREWWKTLRACLKAGMKYSDALNVADKAVDAYKLRTETEF